MTQYALDAPLSSIKATIRISREQRGQCHPTQEFRTRADGRVELRMETTGRKELIRWVLSWMPEVKVLAPQSLHDRIVEKLQGGLRAQE